MKRKCKKTCFGSLSCCPWQLSGKYFLEALILASISLVKPRTILRCPWLGQNKFYLSWIFSYLILSVSKTSSRGQHFGTQIFFSPKQLSPFISSLWLSRIIFSHTKATGPFNDWPFEELSVSRYCSTHWYGFPKNYSGLQKWLTF